MGMKKNNQSIYLNNIHLEISKNFVLFIKKNTVYINFFELIFFFWIHNEFLKYKIVKHSVFVYCIFETKLFIPIWIWYTILLNKNFPILFEYIINF